MIANFKYLLSFFLVIILFSCASYSPIFNKNKKFIDVGPKVANKDFENCKEDAENYLKEYLDFGRQIFLIISITEFFIFKKTE